MEFLKPPTDNLYKFIAIGGVAIIGVCLYVSTTVQSELFKAEQQFLKESIDRTEQYGEFPNSTLPFFRPLFDNIESPKVNFISRSPEDRDLFLNYLYQSRDSLRPKTAPPTPEEMDAYFQRQDVKDYFVIEKAMSSKTYEAMAQQMTLPRFNSMVKPQIDFFLKAERLINRRIMAMSEFWGIVDTHLHHNSSAAMGAVAGVCIAAAGFILWWIMVQRHEDRILLNKRNHNAQ